MALRISPGPLPPDGTRIKVDETMLAFVGGTTIENIGAADITTGTARFIIAATEAPATEIRTIGTLWFERGRGALWKWTPVPFLGGVHNETEFRWCQLGGAARSGIVFVRQPCLRGETLQLLMEISGGPSAIPQGTNTDFNFKHLRGQNGAFTIQVSSTSPHQGHLGRQFVLDPVFVAETDISGASGQSQFWVMADFGFVDAYTFGGGRFGCLYGYGPPQAVSESQLYFQCTEASAAGANAAIAALVSQSSATDGLQVRKVFLRPSVTNLVHGENA